MRTTSQKVAVGRLKAHSLMPFVTNPRLLKAAARIGMRRASTRGADGVTWSEYRRGLDQRISELSRRLAEGTWEPSPVRQVHVEFITSKMLTISIPTVEDRIVHRTLRNALEPIIETVVLRDFVSGFRPRRSRLTSVRQAKVLLDAGLTQIADVDVANVSGGVSVSDVMEWMSDWVADGPFLALICKILEALPSPMAIGGGLSPTLINLRLSRVDNLLAALPLVRFADNYCAFAATRTEARRYFNEIEDALLRHGLHVAESKSSVRAVNAEDLFLVAG